MHWEELTGDEFPQAVAKAEGVCLLPLSVVERHAHHLPLGTDVYIARELCRRVAALEPAIIFPDFIFTQIYEARHHPGTVAIEPTLILALLENVCREIARNGFKKIVIINGHGGNNALIPFFLQTQLASPRDCLVYVVAPQTDEPMDGHAGTTETSAIMVIRPDLVHGDKIYSDGEWQARGRLDALREQDVSTGIWWYADHPTHFSADPNPSTTEAGERYLAATAAAIAQAVRAIKDDGEAKRLQDEFFAASQH